LSRDASKIDRAFEMMERSSAKRIWFFCWS